MLIFHKGKQIHVCCSRILLISSGRGHNISGFGICPNNQSGCLKPYWTKDTIRTANIRTWRIRIIISLAGLVLSSGFGIPQLADTTVKNPNDGEKTLKIIQKVKMKK